MSVLNEKSVDALLEGDPDETRRVLVTRVPIMEESHWDIFRSAFAYRARTNRYAAELLQFATSIRAIAPVITPLLSMNQQQAVVCLTLAAGRLDNSRWTMFVLVLAGQVTEYRHLQSALLYVLNARKAVILFEELKQLPLARAWDRFTQPVLAMDGEEWFALQNVLELYAETIPYAAQLLLYATHVVQAQNVITKMLQGAEKDDFALILSIATSLGAEAWLAMQATLAYYAQSNIRVQRSLAAAQFFRTINDEIDNLLKLPRNVAQQNILQKVPALSSDDWDLYEFVFVSKSQNNSATNALYRYARDKRIDHQEAQLRTTARAIVADGNVTSSERSHYADVQSRLRIAADRANQILVEVEQERETALMKLRTHIVSFLADDHISPEEQAQIDLLCDSLHISPQSAHHIINEVRQDQQRQRESVATLRAHVEYALSDTVLTDEEANQIDDLCVQLGISPHTANQIIAEVRIEQQRMQKDQRHTWAQDLFRQNLQLALADMVISADEAHSLEQLRHQLDISEHLAGEIYRQVRQDMHTTKSA